MQKKRLIFVAAGGVLILISLVLVGAYLKQKEAEYKAKARNFVEQARASQTSVLVATQDLPKGIAIDPSLLQAAIIPNQYLQPQAVTSLDRVAGMVTAVAINKGEQITFNKLVSAKQVGGGGLAELTPVGKRAITISVENVASLIGMIKPGDYVDVIGMIPLPAQTLEGKPTAQAAVVQLFQNVLVLAVGQQTGTATPPPTDSRYSKPAEAKEGSPFITLALSPQEANLIAFVQDQGKVRLVLRSPADSQIQPIQPATFESLLQYLMPQQSQEAPVKVKEEAEYVEIYRGLNKEKMVLTK